MTDDDGGRVQLQLQDGLAQLLLGAGARRLHQLGPLHVQRGWRDFGRRRLNRVVAERLYLHRADIPVLHFGVVLDPQELLLGRVEHGRRDWHYRPRRCHVRRRGRAQVGSGHVPDHLGRYRRVVGAVPALLVGRVLLVRAEELLEHLARPRSRGCRMNE